MDQTAGCGHRRNLIGEDLVQVLERVVVGDAALHELVEHLPAKGFPRIGAYSVP